MSRPRVYRDPIHNQIRYDAVDLAAPLPASPRSRLSWVMQKLIDQPEFQRLRHVRQNALANIVFHGAEHSRFCHSMGAAHLAGEMYDRIVRNMGETIDYDRRLATSAAALLHDLGHGPFSHTLEEILADAGIQFEHEVMTRRFLTEDTGVRKVLDAVDPGFAAEVVGFIQKGAGRVEHWTHKLVSSQLDADRLDYLMRDAASAGLSGQGFDLPWLLDMLGHVDGTRIAVDERAIESVESYLVALDQMYRIIYFHKAVRAADTVLGSALRRALWLARERGDPKVFPPGNGGSPHPLRVFFETGEACPLDQYARLGEYHVWALVEDWRHHPDPLLSDLSARLMDRRLFKARELGARAHTDIQRLVRRAEKAAMEVLPFLDEETVSYYVTINEPSRTSYRRYDWRSEDPDESIWIVRKSGEPLLLEEFPGSEVVAGLRRTRSYPRLIYPPEIRERLGE